VRKTLFGATLAFAVTALGCGDGIGDITSGGPSATPTTANATCQLARLPNCDAQCCREGGSVIHRAELDAAQNSLRNRRPDLYLSNGDVRDNFQWMQVLAQELLNNTNGRVCAEPLGHDEIRVKSDQSVSQHVDVLISDRTPWVGGAYTCRPASF
jgi:hypothetical protein